MFKPYNPCNHCTQPKETCSKCGYTNAQLNYNRALQKITELSKELGKPITILT